MGIEYRSLEVTCPFCQTVKSIKIPDAVFTQKKFGSIKVQVPAGAVCPEHQFIVFVDTKGIIRGYEKIDLLMSVSIEEAKTKDKKPGWITIKGLIQRFGFYGLFSLIHAKLFNYPHYIIKKKEGDDISELLIKVGENLMPEKYKGTTHSIQFLDEIDYNRIKLKEKDALLIDSQLNILQTPWDEKLKFEEAALKKALEIIEEKEQLLIIQQDISKLIKEAELVESILSNVKEIYEDDLIELISKELKIPKITKYRLTLIKIFITRNINSKLTSKIKNKVQEFLDFL